MAEARPEPLPEIPFADATGDVRLIYDAISEALGVGLVNLVYRHLATRPGCLEWTWSVLGPSLQDGTLARHAERLIAMVGGNADAGHPGAAVSLGRLGFDSRDAASVLRTIDAYNRANPVNAVAFRLLRFAVDNDLAAPRFTSPPPAGPRLDALLPMAAFDGLPRPTLDLLHRLATQTVGEDTPMIPSLFRHFTDWPELLNAFSEIFRALGGSAERTAVVAQIMAAAEECASTIFDDLAESGGTERLAPPLRTAVTETAENFVPAICNMIVIGGLLRRSLIE